MDALWNGLGIFCICLSICMMIFSLYTLLKVRKQIHHILVPGEKMPPWYSNAILRKQSEFLFNGGLLILFIVGLMLFQKHSAFAPLWIALSLFLTGCSRLAFMLFEEGGERFITRETGENTSRWSRAFRFHQGIAIALFLLGISIVAFLNGLVSIKVLTFEGIDRLTWIGVGLILIGGLYWLIVQILQEIKKRRARSSSSQSLR